MKTILQFFVFQVEWWLCVLHSRDYFQYGFVLAFLMAVITVYINKLNGMQILAVLVMALLGFANDILLVKLSLLSFQRNLWLGVLWLCFALWFYETTWLHKKYILTPLLFMFFGPLTYLAGSYLEALQLSALEFSYIFIGLVDWLIIGSIFMIIVRKWPKAI